MMRRLAPLLLVALGAFAQQPTPTLKVQSRIVLLDISVTDKAGHPVTDLGPDDFHIFEQKAEQQILSFEPPSAHAIPTAAAGTPVVNSTADLARIGDSGITIFVLDELNTDRHDAIYSRDKLIDWLSRQPAVLPQPVAVSALTYSNFDLLRDFTQDRDALLAILKKHSAGVLWRSENSGTVGPQASENMFTTLGALERISQAMRGVPGRKNLIWVGKGFPPTNYGDTGRTDGDQITTALRRISNIMLHARVTLSVIGPTLSSSQQVNLETAQDGEAASSGTVDGLNVRQTASITFAGLAPPTGGHAFGSRNDLDAEIGLAVADGQTYYTLSYRPSAPNDDPKQYRGISVRVSRPGLIVQTRDGYFGEPKDPPPLDKNATQQLAFDLNGAALSQFAYTDLHLTAERVDATDDFILHASAKDITWRDLPDGRRHADLVIEAACLNQHGKMVAKPTFTTLGSSTEASITAIALVNAALHVHVVPPQGTTRIRFVVRDMTGGRVGTADYTP
jgi:VWFA-related protein